MNNQIDLSKAHKGQIVTLRNSEQYQIGKVINNGLSYSVVNSTWSDIFAYLVDGKSADSISESDIVAIEDAPEIKLIKKRSEVEGLEYALKYVSNPFERGKLCARIDELKAEILILTAETYENS